MGEAKWKEEWGLINEKLGNSKKKAIELETKIKELDHVIHDRDYTISVLSKPKEVVHIKKDDPEIRAKEREILHLTTDLQLAEVEIALRSDLQDDIKKLNEKN